MAPRCLRVASVLLVGAVAVAACGASNEESTTSEGSSTTQAPESSAPDDFTRVRTSDVDSGSTSPVDPSTADTAVANTPAATDVGSSSSSSVPPGSGTTVTAPAGTVASSVPGGSSGSPGAPASAQDQALADAFTAQFEADEDGFGEVFDPGCLGPELVAASGGAAAAESKYGITAAAVDADGDLMDDIEFSEADAKAMVAGFARCGSFEDLLNLSLSDGAGGDEDSRCVVAAIRDGLLEAAFAEELQGLDEGPFGAELDDALDAAFDDCLA